MEIIAEHMCDEGDDDTVTKYHPAFSTRTTFQTQTRFQ